MPLNQLGLTNYGSDIDRKVKERIDKVFSMLDRHIGELSKTAGLSPAQVKLLQPLHQYVVVGDVSVFVLCLCMSLEQYRYSNSKIGLVNQ